MKDDLPGSLRVAAGSKVPVRVKDLCLDILFYNIAVFILLECAPTFVQAFQSLRLKGGHGTF